MSEIKVSVIFPVYNVENYLRQCLNSVVNQTLKEIEIICVDDGSTDASAEILDEYAAKDSRITVLRQKNGGAGAARNNGLRIAKGKYLSFLDSDDFFELNMLEEAYNCAEKYSADLVIFKSNQYFEDSDSYKNTEWVVRYAELPPYQPFNRRSITSNIFKACVGWAWDKLFSREFVLKNNLLFQEQRTSNDMLFVFSAIAIAEKIAYVDKSEILAHQRRDSTDSLSKTKEKSWDCFYKALIALRDRLKQDGIFQEVERDYINYALHFALWNLNSLSQPTYDKLYKKLNEEWWKELGIDGKTRSYFYNKKEFLQYVKIRNNEY